MVFFVGNWYASMLVYIIWSWTIETASDEVIWNWTIETASDEVIWSWTIEATANEVIGGNCSGKVVVVYMGLEKNVMDKIRDKT